MHVQVPTKMVTWYSLKNVERKQRKVSEARTDMVYAASALARVSAVCIFRPLSSRGFNWWKICQGAQWGSLLNVVYTMQNSERKTTVQTQSTHNFKQYEADPAHWHGFSVTYTSTCPRAC